MSKENIFKSKVRMMMLTYQNKEFEKAKRMALSLIEDFPEVNLCWKIITDIHLQKGEFDEALKSNQKAIDINPNDPEAHNIRCVILKKLNKEGFLIIEDWDPSFNHTNINGHNKKLMTFKMNYSNLLEQSGLFKMIHKNRFPIHNSFNKKFKSNDASIGLYKKIDFIKEYPEGQ